MRHHNTGFSYARPYIYVPKSSMLMNTISISGFWYIYERAYETPQYGILISTPIYVPKSSMLLSTTSISGFWYIYERAYETPQYGFLISTPIYVPKFSMLMSTTSITVFWYIQLFQLRLSTSKAEKSNTSAKGCWESLTN